MILCMSASINKGVSLVLQYFLNKSLRYNPVFYGHGSETRLHSDLHTSSFHGDTYLQILGLTWIDRKQYGTCRVTYGGSFMHTNR